MICIFPHCQTPEEATLTTRAMNGLPQGVACCANCKAAVKRSEVGVVRREDGSLHVTDARRGEFA